MSEAPRPPDCRTPAEVVAYLRRLREWAGMSFRTLTRRINKTRKARGVDVTTLSTVTYCFDEGRVRLDRELVVDIAAALGLDQANTDRLREVCVVATGPRPISTLADVTGSLPAGRDGFIGRDEPAARIIAAVESGLDDGSAPLVTLHGPAGIGKTELAIQCGRALVARGRFPDGQLFADLHGFDVDRDPTSTSPDVVREPTPPGPVFDRLLKLLGMRDSSIWALIELNRKRAKVRELLHGKRILMVLDNIADDSQLKELRLDVPGCAILVTSRHRLAAGSAVEVSPLDLRSSVELLAGFDAVGRVRAEPDVADHLADKLCGGFPLDLVTLGGQLANPSEHHWSLADHAERLAGYPRDEVSRPALTGSYLSLDEATRRLFRLSALFGNDFSRYDLAVLADVDVDSADRALTRMYDRHLLLTRMDDRHLLRGRRCERYRMHDAVAAFAMHRLRREEPPSAQRAAIARLRDAETHKHTGDTMWGDE